MDVKISKDDMALLKPIAEKWDVTQAEAAAKLCHVGIGRQAALNTFAAAKKKAAKKGAKAAKKPAKKGAKTKPAKAKAKARPAKAKAKKPAKKRATKPVEAIAEAAE